MANVMIKLLKDNELAASIVTVFTRSRSAAGLTLHGNV
jgi:hypothetical protein